MACKDISLGWWMTKLAIGFRQTLPKFQGSNFIVAIMVMASDKGKMAIDKMKLDLKSQDHLKYPLGPRFGPSGYFRKACTCLTSYKDIFLWALVYFASKMWLFTEHIHNGNLSYFFAELLLMPSNLSAMQSFFRAITCILAHKHAKRNKYRYSNKAAKLFEFDLNSMFAKRL